MKTLCNHYIRCLVVAIVCLLINQSVSAQNYLYDVKPSNDKYTYSVTETPADLVPYSLPAGTIPTTTYLWQSSNRPLDGFVTIAGSTSASLHFTAPLTQTMYFKRFMVATSQFSAVIKLELGSANWENLNYIRENDILIAGQNNSQSIDQLVVGQKSQLTNYKDGLGRVIQTVEKQASNQQSTGGVYSDIVKFHKYDEFGREPKNYLSYVTSENIGKFKIDVFNSQGQYFNSTYNESNAFNELTYDGSPLNIVNKITQSGTSWTGQNSGTAIIQRTNVTSDQVHKFKIGYNIGDIPIDWGIYGQSELSTIESHDEHGNVKIEFFDNTGKLILSKVQADLTVTDPYIGWMSTYFVYDDFERIRFEISPKATIYLSQNYWHFDLQGGGEIINELCTEYRYDIQGRVIYQKSPGKLAVLSLYDERDRLVFTQDGNQATPAQRTWTGYLYDELNRPIIKLLYNSQLSYDDLESQILNSQSGTITINNVGGGAPVQDIFVDQRNSAIGVYSAQNSIEFLNGFESLPGDEFIAVIDPNAVTQPISVTYEVYANPIPVSELNDPVICNIQKYEFYDNYSFLSSQNFYNGFENLQAYNTSDPIVSSKRSIDHLTGELTKVISTNTFLASSYYYDKKGRLIQENSENILFGNDITTYQYSFDNRLLSINEKHTSPNTGYIFYSVLTKNIFDNIGRIVEVQKKFPGSGFKPIVMKEYDDVGRIKLQNIDPAYNGIPGRSGMESLKYEYNLHNALIGINKDYALKTIGTYNKWLNFFGLYLGYDNRDNSFANARFDNKITGVIWNTQGDDEQRKYDYEYSVSGNLTAAKFNQKDQASTNWQHTSIDLSTTNIQYDYNGNITALKNWGVIPGAVNQVKIIDDLHYTYDNNNLSNKLIKVDDINNTLGLLNGKLGDFADGNNGVNSPTNDYTYDFNGNLSKDLNKEIKDLTFTGSPGIKYNYLNKPELIKIPGKGTYKYVYDADGNRLQKIFTPDVSGAPIVTTSYINNYIFVNNELQFINFGEGRLRVLTKTDQDNGYDYLHIDGSIDMPNNKRGVFDFYIKDHLSNVRMMVTEESHIGQNQCRMELSRDANEAPLFGQVDPTTGQPNAANEVRARFAVTSIPGYNPITTHWMDISFENYVSKLGGNAANIKIGPNTLLKVMSGDKISTGTDYYFDNTTLQNPPDNGSVLLPGILSVLTNVISSSSAANDLVKASSSSILSGLSDPNPGTIFNQVLQPDASNNTGPLPKAYLTVLFFDERFNFIEEGSYSKLVEASGPNGSIARNMSFMTRAPKNGYALVFVSNESETIPVYFDNFVVNHLRGRIIEEDHYYAYGLKIAGISSRKLGDANEGRLANQYQYQADYCELDDETGWNDFELRNYDPQIGRFIEYDPFEQLFSAYVGMGADPINNIDPSGGIFEGLSAVSQFTIKHFVPGMIGAVVGAATTKGSANDKLQGAGVGFVVAFAGSYINLGGIGTAIVNTSKLFADVYQRQSTMDNIVIVIAKGGGKEDYMKAFNNTDDGTWHIIVKNTMKEANVSLQKYRKKRKLKNIIIDTHGIKEGNQIVNDATDPDHMLTIDETRVKKFNDEGINYSSVLALKNIGSSLNNNGNLVILSCNLVKNGTSMLEEVSKLFSNDINIYGSNVLNNGLITTNQLKVDSKLTKDLKDPHSMKLDQTLLNEPGSFFRANSKTGSVIKLKGYKGLTGNLQISSSGVPIKAL